MKYLFVIGIILAISALFLLIKRTPETKMSPLVIQKDVKIQGEIHNSTNKYLIMKYSLDKLNETIDTIYFTNAHYFSKVFKGIKKPFFLDIYNENVFLNKIFLAPEYNLVLKADGSSESKFFKSATFTGKGSYVNNYVVSLLRDEQLKRATWNSGAVELTEGEYKEKLNQYFKIRKNIFDQYFNDSQINEDAFLTVFKAIEMQDIKYFQAIGLISFLKNKKYTNQTAKDYFNRNIDKTLLTNKEKESIYSDNYKGFFSHFYLGYLIDRDNEIDTTLMDKYGYYAYALQKVNSTYKSPIKEYTLASLLSTLVNLTNSYPTYYPRIDSLLAIYGPLVNNPTFQKKLNERYLELKEVDLKNTMVDLPVLDLNGNHKNINKDFKGSVILVDVWASWCKPCIEEMAHTRELEKRLIGKKFKLLTVSIDQKEEKWLWGVKEFNPPGIQLFAQGGFKGEFSKKLQIESIPRYILIDKNGFILDPYAIRPSKSKELLQRIESLIN